MAEQIQNRQPIADMNENPDKSFCSRPEMEKGIPLEDIEGTVRGSVPANLAGDARKPLDDGIASLPAKLREIFLLHDVQGFKHEEIARLMGISVGTSKSQLFKARLRMRAFLSTRGVC